MTVGPAPGQVIVALTVAIFPGAAIAIGICVAAGIRDLDNAGFAVFVGVVAVRALWARAGRTSDGGSRADWPTAGW
jgi:hypothetical protein